MSFAYVHVLSGGKSCDTWFSLEDSVTLPIKMTTVLKGHSNAFLLQFCWINVWFGLPPAPLGFLRSGGMNPKARAHDCRGNVVEYFLGGHSQVKNQCCKPMCKNFVEGSNDRYYNVSWYIMINHNAEIAQVFLIIILFLATLVACTFCFHPGCWSRWLWLGTQSGIVGTKSRVNSLVPPCAIDSSLLSFCGGTRKA